ncbi:MAG: glycosyltransferase family 39 protein, partial [Anaerolineales bacterium]
MNPEDKPPLDPNQDQDKEEKQQTPPVELHFEAPAGTRLQITVEQLPAESRGANLHYRVEFDPQATALPATITLGAEDAIQIGSRASWWARMARRWSQSWGAIQSGPIGKGWAVLWTKLSAWAPKYQVVLFGLALLIYLLTRLIALEDFPIYFFTDEAVQTQLAADFIRDGFRGYDGVLLPTYFENASLFNLSLSVYVQVLPTFFFGKSVFVTRAVSVLITLTGVWAVGLILKNIFKLKLWWAGVLVLSITPVWFLHSRTAFETVIMVSMYAWFLYFYLLYREKDPKYLYLALLFGALTFYSYSPGQLIMVGTGLFLLFSDLRYHLEHKRTSLIGLGVLILVAAPYVRFQLQHSGETYFHLRMLNSYWLDEIPLAEKLKTFAAYYTRALDPTYWYLSNEHDLARHRMDGMGNILWPTFPFMLIGLLLTLRNIKKSSHRSLVGATLMAPLGVSIVGIGITRVMALLVPLTVFTTMGLDWVGYRIHKRMRPPTFAGLVFVVLALVNIGLLSTSLRAGPTWFSDYGLNGMQYGARQVYTTAWEMLQDDPGIKISITPT